MLWCVLCIVLCHYVLYDILVGGQRRASQRLETMSQKCHLLHDICDDDVHEMMMCMMMMCMMYDDVYDDVHNDVSDDVLCMR